MGYAKLQNPQASGNTTSVTTGTFSALDANKVYLLDYQAQLRNGATTVDLWLNGDTTALNYAYGKTGFSTAAEGLGNLTQTLVANKAASFRGYVALIGGQPVIIGTTRGEGAPSSMVFAAGNTALSSITEISISTPTTDGFAAGTEIALAEITDSPSHEVVASSATTTMSIGSLSLTDDTPYLVVIGGENAAGASNQKLYFNSDVTDANYYYGRIQSDGTEGVGSLPIQLGSNASSFLFVGLLAIVDTEVVLTGLSANLGATGVARSHGMRHDTITAITGIQLTCDTANGIDNGFIRLYDLSTLAA